MGGVEKREERRRDKKTAVLSTTCHDGRASGGRTLGLQPNHQKLIILRQPFTNTDGICKNSLRTPRPPQPTANPACPLQRILLRTPHTIACIGRNYAAHIKELGNAATKEPFFFLKPPGSLLHPSAGPILMPKGVELHYEVELVAVMGREADDLNAENALDAVKGWCVGIDMTARNCTRISPPLGRK